MSFVFVYVPKPRFVIAGSPVAGCGPYGCQLRALRLPIAKRGKETGIAILCMKLCGIIYTSNPQLSSSASFLRLNVLSSLN